MSEKIEKIFFELQSWKKSVFLLIDFEFNCDEFLSHNHIVEVAPCGRIWRPMACKWSDTDLRDRVNILKLKDVHSERNWGAH